MERELTHINEEGAARMVDVGAKPVTARRARAGARVLVQAGTLQAVRDNSLHKGEVLGVARIAGVMAAKRCSDLLPLCHPLRLDDVEVSFELTDEPPAVVITTQVACRERTGVEMEALTAASVSALCVYDMIKAVDRSAVITDLRVLSKSGGQSGDYEAEVSDGRGAVGQLQPQEGE